LFESFSGVLTQVMQGGQDGIATAISAVFTGGATGGLNTLGDEAAKAGEALGSVLAAAAGQAATQMTLSGTAAAANAAKEIAASTAKTSADITLVSATAVLTKAFFTAAAAANSFSASGGGKGSGLLQIVGQIGTALFGGGGKTSFGGFRASGGPMAAGSAYMVGERGREIVVPQVPSFVIPNGAFGGGNVTIVDKTSISIQGASTAEIAQLQQTVRTMIQTRNQSAVQAVRDAMRRPRGLG